VREEGGREGGVGAFSWRWHVPVPFAWIGVREGGRERRQERRTRLGVTEEVGADALLGRVLGLELGAPVRGPTDTKGGGLALHVVAVAGGGD